MAADYACKTRNPEDPEGDRIDVIFPAELTQRFYKFTPVRYWNLTAAKAVLDDVKRIFWGIREFNPGGWCFTGRPEVWYIRQDVTATFPEHLVFAVYLNPRNRVYECRAERASDDDQYSPIDWRDRFGGLKWESTS